VIDLGSAEFKFTSTEQMVKTKNIYFRSCVGSSSSSSSAYSTMYPLDHYGRITWVASFTIPPASCTINSISGSVRYTRRASTNLEKQHDDTILYTSYIQRTSTLKLTRWKRDDNRLTHYLNRK